MSKMQSAIPFELFIQLDKMAGKRAIDIFTILCQRKKINTSAKSKGNAVVHLGFIEIFAVDRPYWEICRIKPTYLSLVLRRFVIVE